MTEIIRDASMIADEINAIKQEVRDTAIRGVIEIGKRLLEAKSMVPYGQWGKWLQENVDYSERTAQDMMRIATEYGKRESQALAEIQNTTQAVLLLALDWHDREQFVQEHDLAAMSTRELEEEIANLKEERDKAQLTIEELMGQLASAEETPAKAEDLSDHLEAEQQKASDLEKALEEARKQVAEAEQRRQNDLHAEQEKIRKAASEIERMRNDLTEARKQAEAKEKQLKRTEEELTEARTKVQTVEVVPEAVEKELETLRRKAAASGAESEMRAAFDGLKAAFERLTDKLREAEETDAETALKYRGAFYRAMLTMAEKVK